MPSLAETQRLMRQAVVMGDGTEIEPLLTGGCHVARRLAIHHRHYEASLIMALLGRYPATVWLVGAPFLTEAAQHFVRQHPPAASCIAEYGEVFPQFLATRPGADRAPYLSAFATLEWHVGHVAVAIDHRAATWEDIGRIGTDVLPHTRIALQPGVQYLQADWPVDDLMTLYLTNTAREQLALEPADVWLEIRGARGEFTITRLDPGDFTFRASMASGRSIGEAAEAAFAIQASFDPGRALATLVAEGAGMALDPQGARSR
jgi:hypothetical protein